MSRQQHTAFLVIGFTLIAAGLVGSPACAADSALFSKTCDLGITLALSGQEASAESAFVSLLSDSPGDARALNDLGNLYLWRGDPGVALAFYGQAWETDSLDAGIILNEATALLLAGEEEEAKIRAAEGVSRAGGTQAAASLLGLRWVPEDGEGTKAADRVQVSRDEVLALLRAATRAVPADSTHGQPAPAGPPQTKGGKKSPVWRSAGARGSEGTDAGAILYWKR